MITLTREQTEQTCADEAKYQLSVMGQYLNSSQKQFYIQMLTRYTSILDYEHFCRLHKIEVNHD